MWGLGKSLGSIGPGSKRYGVYIVCVCVSARARVSRFEFVVVRKFKPSFALRMTGHRNIQKKIGKTAPTLSARCSGKKNDFYVSPAHKLQLYIVVIDGRIFRFCRRRVPWPGISGKIGKMHRYTKRLVCLCPLGERNGRATEKKTKPLRKSARKVNGQKIIQHGSANCGQSGKISFSLAPDCFIGGSWAPQSCASSWWRSGDGHSVHLTFVYG